MTDTPFISVIIPLYNKEATIRRTIQSVIDQDFNDFELIVIDDGSTDNSFKTLSYLTDSRIRIISEKNGGVSDARNFGILNAIGEYIFFLDADDILRLNCFSHFNKLVKEFKDESVFVCNFNLLFEGKEKKYCIGKGKKRIHKTYKALWFKTIFPRAGAMLIKKPCFTEVGLFDEKLSVYEDLEFVLRLIKKYDVVYSSEIVMTYNCDSNFLSISNIDFNREFANYIDFKKKSFYEKLILLEILYNTYKKRSIFPVNSNDPIVLKAKKYTFRILMMRIYRKISKIVKGKSFFNKYKWINI